MLRTGGRIGEMRGRMSEIADLLEKLKQLDPMIYDTYMYADDHPELEGNLDKAWLQFCIQRAIDSKFVLADIHLYKNGTIHKTTIFAGLTREWSGEGKTWTEALLSAYIACLESQPC